MKATNICTKKIM